MHRSTHPRLSDRTTAAVVVFYGVATAVALLAEAISRAIP